jgi:hypothetical protein
MAKPGYHHYIPRFLFSNFPHSYKSTKAKAEQQKGIRGPCMYPGEKVLNDDGMRVDGGPFIETHVKRTFGHKDMYKNDPGLSLERKNEVERKFGHLEHTASYIIRRFTAAQANDVENMQLIWEEHFNLMKFVFVMKFCSTSFFERYNHQSPENYAQDDKDDMLRYISKH